MRINTNISAMNTYSRLTNANSAKSSSLAKLSSGLRINKAGDDAAGLAISEKMKNQISGLTQASRNAQDGISLIQTAEGALSETHNILNRMRDLTVQAANGTNTGDDKTAIQSEIDSLSAEIDRIAGTTTFNTQGLMDGVEFSGGAGSSIADLGTAENTELSKAINGVAGTTLAVAGATAGTDIANELNSLTRDDLGKVMETYNTEINKIYKADLDTVDGWTISETKGDYDTIAAKHGITVLGGTAGDALTVENISTLKAELESKLKNNTTKFDLGDSKDTSFKFQIGANAGENITVDVKNMSAKGLGIDDVNVSATGADFDLILGNLDTAIKNVSDQRANLGAVQNRLDHTVSNLSTTKENLSEANSRIRDVDMAEEMMSFTKNNILSQAATSMLAQANQMPQGVLSLLQ